MSLYYEAAAILSTSPRDGSLKSKIYANSTNLKSKPAQIYALITESTKYDEIVAEIIENAEILLHEPKNGISAPPGHPLRLAVERHKARLHAECTKARIRRKCASVDDLKVKVLADNGAVSVAQPRWIRVNTLRTTLADQLTTTFAGYRTDASIEDICGIAEDSKILHQDVTVPDLLCIRPEVDFARLLAYRSGALILQDKASCFPAYLLLGQLESDGVHIGDIMDACAAPGNKTTHLAALALQYNNNNDTPKTTRQIFACERDAKRSTILQTMVSKAGASNVTVLAKQDFLALDPHDRRFKNVTHLLLDPSCSGSGILGREDIPVLKLPKDPKINRSNTNHKKRKRVEDDVKNVDQTVNTTKSDDFAEETREGVVNEIRLEKLSNLQSRIVEHAFAFPAATRVSYSTCSLHVQENEAVVQRVLRSDIARKGGWRVMRRDEQPQGLREWSHRGLASRGTQILGERIESDVADISSDHGLNPIEVEACVRCSPNDGEGTMGFFVCGFVRDKVDAMHRGEDQDMAETVVGGIDVEAEEWGGFSDED